ncbi:hypothetical protein GJQ54_11220 [Oceanospirillaceae bacterium ASx5O]|nr:hypothetical protein GJQ54_11220 [Oceanospirillaceae bacterium ASx5O]
MMNLRCTECYREHFARTHEETKECPYCREPLELVHISQEDYAQARMVQLTVARAIMQREELRAWEAYDAVQGRSDVSKAEIAELHRVAKNRTDVLGEIEEALADEEYLRELLADVMQFATPAYQKEAAV